MDVVLIKSPELSVEEYSAVVDLLCSFSGPIKFAAPARHFIELEFWELENDISPSARSNKGG